eukprot:gene1555-1694_t
MENSSDSSVNVAANASASGMVTPVKSTRLGKSTRCLSATKADNSRGFWSSEKKVSRPATARKADIASSTTSTSKEPFSPSAMSMNESILSTASESREAARQAKMKSEQDRINKVAQLKLKWAQEKERKTTFHQTRRAEELKRLQDENNFAAELRKKQLDKQKELSHKEKMVEKELLSTSLKVRAQLAEDLSKEAKAKRRISLFLNQQMRKRAQTKEEALAKKKKEEEASLLESRRVDCLLQRDAQMAEEVRRRESLAQQTLRAQELRKKEEELENQKKEEERALLEMRHLNWEDDKTAKDEAERLRRESLAYRLDKWRSEKELTQSMKEQERLAADMDFELQTQARQDMLNYQEKCAESRRQSLSYRLDKARKDRDFERGQKALIDLVHQEESKLKEQDRDDIQQYRDRILEARRQSMQYRSQAFRQEKMRMEGEKQAERVEQQMDFTLREQSWKDVQAYRAKQREEARRSLAWRLADAHRQQEAALTMHEENLRKTHLDLLCRREDMLTQREAQEQEAQRRRRSISLRLQSWRECKMREEKEKERIEMEKEEDALLREMDREELLAAKLTCDLMQRRDALTQFIL